MADDKPVERPSREPVVSGGNLNTDRIVSGDAPDIRGLDDQQGVPEVSPGTEIEKDGPPDF